MEFNQREVEDCVVSAFQWCMVEMVAGLSIDWVIVSLCGELNILAWYHEEDRSHARYSVRGKLLISHTGHVQSITFNCGSNL